MKKKHATLVVVAAALALLLPVAGYIAQPYFMMDRLGAALVEGDVERMQWHIDFPRLRASLIQQAVTDIREKGEGNPLAEAMAVPLFTDMIEQAVRPEMFAMVVAHGTLRSSGKPGEAAPALPREMPQPSSMRFTGARDFLVEYENLALMFRFNDLRWQLVDIRFGEHAAVTAVAESEKNTTVRIRSPERNPASAQVSEEQLDDSALPVSVDPAELDEILGFAGTQFFFRGTTGNEILVEGDVFHIPNIAFAEFNVNWDSVTDAAGAERLREPDEDKRTMPAMIMEGTWRGSMPVSAADADIAGAKGTATLELPVTVHSAKLAEGETADIGEFTVDSVSINGDSVDLIVRGVGSNPPAARNLLVVGFNEKGQRLAQQSRLRMPAGDLARLRESGKEPQDYRVSVSTKGRIDHVGVYIPVAFAKRQFTVTATPEPPAFPEPDTQIATSRFVPPQPAPPYAGYTREELAPLLQVEPGRSEALMTKGRAQLTLQLPAAPNSQFADIEYTRVELFDAANQPVPFKQEKYYNELRLDPAEGDAPLLFARAAGEYRVVYPAQVETMTFKAGDGALPSHVKVEPHRLLLDPDRMKMVAGGNPFPDVQPVRAYDANGRELYPLHDGRDFKSGMYEYWFWGEIHRVEVDVVAESLELVQPFEVQGPPAP